MEAVERLSLEDVRSGTLLACEHLQRYELAATLCEGLAVADLCCGSGYGASLLLDRGARSVIGVDNDAPTIEAARARLAAPPRLDFELADAVEFLEREPNRRFDAIVVFEGIEHLEQPERALAALRRRAERGVKCAVSIPNSRALGEQNPYHRTDYGYDEALAALHGLGKEVVLLYQYPAEGSLIRPEPPGELEGRFMLDDAGEPRLCSHFLGFVNFDRAALERAGHARMQLAVAPQNRRYMLELERRVGVLWEELKKLERARDEEIAAIEGSASWRITAPLRAAKRALTSPRAGSRQDAGGRR